MTGVKGKSGRKPLTEEERARHLIEKECGVDPHTPPPESLGDHGKSVWHEMLPLLAPHLRTIHLRALTAYCIAWERCLSARDVMDGEMTVYSDRGMSVHPLVAVENAALSQIGAYGKRLGLEVSGPVGAPVQEHDGAPTAEDIIRLRRG